jgi:hypothetical protein
MDEAAIRRALDDCLVPVPAKGRIDVKAWRSLRDPFPQWGQGEMT